MSLFIASDAAPGSLLR